METVQPPPPLESHAEQHGLQLRWLLSWKSLLLATLGLLLLVWLNYTPGGLLGKADAIGYAVCHRIDVRSFHMGVRQLPLCARCSGMYLGTLLGLAFLAVIGPRRGGMPSRRLLAVFGMLAVAFAIDGLNSYLHFFPNAPGMYEPNNTLRLLTGTGVGLGIAAVVYPAFNQTAWKQWDPRPALGSMRQLVVLIGLGLVLDLLILSENSLILYPLALLSAGGELILLSIVYGMVLMMLFKAENKLQHLSQLIWPLAGGLMLAIIQIGLLDFGRYLLTGTWAGFKLG